MGMFGFGEDALHRERLAPRRAYREARTLGAVLVDLRPADLRRRTGEIHPVLFPLVVAPERVEEMERGKDATGSRIGSAMKLINEVNPPFERLLVYAWRRNLAVAISRMVADAEPEGPVGVVRTVGFADLVSFTQLVRQLSERELAQLVLRFEALASDIVSSHGGALVKTVGDEVLFTHQEISGAVDIAFDLLEVAAADDLVPRMRVGMATGRVLARLGDIYGNTVNRAARLTSQARPGTVLADAQVAAAVSDRPHVRTAALEPIDLPGIGELVPWALQHQGPTSPDEGDA